MVEEEVKEHAGREDGPINYDNDHVEGSLEICADSSVALIVDDESMNVFCARAQLLDIGISCDSTLISTKAVNLVEERIKLVAQGVAEMYKVMLIDYSMPDMDGLELVKKLRTMIEDSLPG